MGASSIYKKRKLLWSHSWLKKRTWRTRQLLAPGFEGETLCFDDGSEADEIEYARAFGAHLGRPIQEIAPFLAPL